MAESTGIAWARSTMNPWIGCTRVSPGCDHCYAEALDARYQYGVPAASRVKGVAPHWGPGAPRYLTSESLWSQPIHWNRDAAWEKENGRLRNTSWESKWNRPGFWPVFCASLADVFDNEVPKEWREALFRLITATPALTWLLLTKRIGNAAKMMSQYVDPDVPNIWLGASVVNQEEADRDIPKLLATPAAKRFVSYEPALGPVDFTSSCDGHSFHDFLRGVRYHDADHGAREKTARLDWVIVGGESAQGGAGARPFNLAWAHSTVAQCRAAGVAAFVKQLGSTPMEVPGGKPAPFEKPGTLWKRLLRDRSGSDPSEWPEELRVQEFPT